VKSKKIIKILPFLSMFILFACNEHIAVVRPPVPELFELVNNNIVLSEGVDFKTGKPVVLNPLTGKTIEPCKQPSTYTSKQQDYQKQKDDQKKNECKIQFSAKDAPASLSELLNNGRESYSGFLLKDGKKIPAKFSNSVSARYDGSWCLVLWSGGYQYEDCVTTKQICNWYVYYPAYITNNVWYTCTSQFPGSGWPSQLIP
jgi:exopolysaccharide biosynthesis protein